MPTKRRKQIAKKQERDLAISLMPHVLQALLTQGIIDPKRATDKEYLWSTVLANIKSGAKKLEILVEAHHQFLDFAKYAHSKNNRAVAVVLLATAIEHIVNLYYRELLTSKGLQSQEITEIIKRNGIEPKMGWMMNVLGGVEIPKDLKTSLINLIELRNSVVHYKAIPWIPDIQNDGWSILEDTLARFDFDETMNVINMFYKFLDGALDDTISTRKLSFEMTQVMCDLQDNN